MELTNEEIRDTLVAIRQKATKLIEDIDRNPTLDRHQFLSELESLSSDLRTLVMHVSRQTPSAPEPPQHRLTLARSPYQNL